MDKKPANDNGANEPSEEELRQEQKRQRAEAAKEHHDELDEALADTFPSSDPPAQVAKGTTSNPRPHEKDERD